MNVNRAWESLYEEDELTERYAIVLEQVQLAQPLSSSRLDAMSFAAEGKSWLYALEQVPTHQMRECFRRAIQTHVGTFPLVAGEVITKWEELKQELLEQNGGSQYYQRLAAAGVPSSLQLNSPPKNAREDYTSLASFKQRRGLPADWKPPGLGQIGRWPGAREPKKPASAGEEVRERGHTHTNDGGPEA